MSDESVQREETKVRPLTKPSEGFQARFFVEWKANLERKSKTRPEVHTVKAKSRAIKAALRCKRIVLNQLCTTDTSSKRVYRMIRHILVLSKYRDHDVRDVANETINGMIDNLLALGRFQSGEIRESAVRKLCCCSLLSKRYKNKAEAAVMEILERCKGKEAIQVALTIQEMVPTGSLKEEADTKMDETTSSETYATYGG